MGNYIKHGKGPNDYKKGNRTRGKDRKGNLKGNPKSTIDNQGGLIQASKDKAEQVEKYKAVADQLAKVTRYGQEYALTLHDNLANYIKEQKDNRQPLTIAGLVRSSGMSADTYRRYKEGKADHLLYMYMDLHGISFDHEGEILELQNGEKIFLERLSTIIKSAELCVQEQRESACSSNKGNPAGNIFLLKAQQGFIDTPETQQTSNTLNINVANLDEAKQALNLLSE